VAYEWFLGRNALGMPVYDKLTGGCRDGVHIDRLNENQGAESTLSFLQSLLEMEEYGMSYPAPEMNNGKESAPRMLVHSSKTR
jgi:hypothetical protein